MIHELFRWLGYWTGIANESGKGYGFWSGIGSCITEFAIIGMVWHKVNCGVHGCWRIGLKKVPGTEHVVCHKHHPLGHVTHQQVIDDHAQAQATAAVLGQVAAQVDNIHASVVPFGSERGPNDPTPDPADEPDTEDDTE